ncbi:hydrogen gas-evolving membrane-bound hydrogenase subunit E [Salinifilum ghardaiensis]
MSPEIVLVAVPVVLTGATVAALPLGRSFGVHAGYPLAVLLAVSGVLLVALLPETLEEPITAAAPWVPALGAEWSLRLDPLALVFGIVITSVGAVTLAYSSHYLGEHHRPAEYYALLTGFAAAMTLLVLAGDALVLYLGWEGTTLASYALIHSAADGARPAIRALLITFLGGLGLLAAILLASAEAGTLALSELNDPANWAPTPLTVFLALLVAAAAVKSAQIPFHVWLPPAMVAPTPVSAYLHAAAMVTAGFYLLLRFANPIAHQPVVAASVAIAGTATAAFAAAAAMRREDLKELLAYSTIGHLGFMIALVGVGTPAAISGALVFFIAHATYKSALFLVSGVCEHVLGTRQLGELAGAARRLPLTAAAAALACVSMAGLPPALGYVGKERALKGLLEHPTGTQWVTAVGAVAALALTVAYSTRIVTTLLSGGSRGDAATTRHGPSFALWPALLGACTVGFGIAALHLTPLIDAAAETAIGTAPQEPLGLWHGVTPAFVTSLAVLAAGGAVYGLRRKRGWIRALPDDVGVRCFDGSARLLSAAGRAVERLVAHPYPAGHLATILVVTAVIVWSALLPLDATAPAADTGPRWIVSLLLAAAAVIVAEAPGRLTVLAVLTAVGFLVAAWYLLHGAPQLAAVQLVVDGLTVALAVFVLQHLPASQPKPRRRHRVAATAAAAVVGSAFAGLSLLQRSPHPSPAGEAYLHEAHSSSTGNLVSAVLTEFRALDTLGETTVIAVAAIGVVAVLRMRGSSS